MFWYAVDISYQFQKNISTLSPETRKRALVIQKQVLEAEQSHLRQLLAEQEAILKLRQDELKVSGTTFFSQLIGHHAGLSNAFHCSLCSIYQAFVCCNLCIFRFIHLSFVHSHARSWGWKKNSYIYLILSCLLCY